MGVCNCSMFCCTLLYVHSSIAIILMGKRELQFVIVVFPDHTHLLFLECNMLDKLGDPLRLGFVSTFVN